MKGADEEVSQRNLTDSPREAIMTEDAENKPAVEESKVENENENERVDEKPKDNTNEEASEENVNEEIEKKMI